MSDREENIIFDFIWGNTYGLFGQGYHVTIKQSEADLYIAYSVDLKYGETKIDEAMLEEYMKELKNLHIDGWNARTFSDSSFENEDTWRLIINTTRLVVDSKGANAYPPEWESFLKYLHEKWSVPSSVREISPSEMKRIREEKALQYTREEKEKEAREKERDRRDRQHSHRGPDKGGRADNNDRNEKHDRHERRGEKRFQDRKEKHEQQSMNQNRRDDQNPGKNDRKKRFRHRKKPVKQ